MDRVANLVSQASRQPISLLESLPICKPWSPEVLALIPGCIGLAHLHTFRERFDKDHSIPSIIPTGKFLLFPLIDPIRSGSL